VPGVVRLGGVLNASGDGISFTVAASGTLGQPLTISGSAPTSGAGGLIDIESAKPGLDNWTEVATASIGSNGSFSAQWTPSTSAKVALRAVLAPGTTPTATGGSSGLSGSGSASTASGELTTSPLTIPIFKDAVATLYGPGLWGHHTACGERLTHAMLGVASRTLKCGTRVSVFYKGRELTVPVIDRGPFGNHASWDLTMATAKALGITETVTVGTLSAAPTAAAVARG
jgi:rare lipoprotein A (peptidoglycan hydrolase)